MSANQWVEACDADEIEEEDVIRFDHGGRTFAVYRLKDDDYRATDGCIDRLRQLIAAEPRDKGFGNGRFVRNLFEAAVASQAWRLRANPSPDVDDLRRLRAEDLPAPTPPT